MSKLRRVGVAAGYLAGGFMLVMMGVNVAPRVYAWQGYLYDWSWAVPSRPVQVPPPAPVVVAAPVQSPVPPKLVADVERVGSELVGLRASVSKLGAGDGGAMEARLSKLESDYKALVELHLATKVAMGELESKMAVKAADVKEAAEPEFPELAFRPRVDRHKARPPESMNAVQTVWVRGLPNYAALRRHMTDLEILRRYGAAHIWEAGEGDACRVAR